MAYDGRIMRRAQARFDEDRRRREDDARKKKEAVFARQPRLREIDAELRTTMSRIISSALRRGTDPRPAVAVLQDRNLSLQEERAGLLAQLGLPADYLEEKPACALCNDSGYHGEAVCRCLRTYYAREQQQELSRMLDLGNQSFDTFSLDWYPETCSALGMSPRENMENTRDICVDYAYGFNGRSGNLLFTGAPGLGKTFLSACGKVIEWFESHETLTLAEFRDLLGTSRKHALAILEYLDKNKMLKKEGDIRRMGQNPIPR